MAWIAALGAIALVRVAVPVAALAASGSRLPGLPPYDFVALTGDGAGFYFATREFIAAWGRLPPAGLAALALGLAVLIAGVAVAWRRRPDLRPWLLALTVLGIGGAVCANIAFMHTSGAAVIGWSLLWGGVMLPYRALGLPLDPEIAFGFGFALSAAANVVTVVATAYAGLYATGRRSVGVVAAALLGAWPFLTGAIAGERAWDNGTWRIDVGLHLYSEPFSTALVTVALALLLRPGSTPLALAGAGALMGLATSVKLTNGLVAALGAIVLALRLGPVRTLPYAAAGLAWLPVVAVYWPLGYASLFENPRSWPRDPFSLGYAGRSWTDSLLFTPTTLAIILPLAMLGAWSLRRRPALPLLLVWVLLNPAVYSFYAVTPLHPRFLFGSLPAFFVLWAAGAVMLASAAAPRVRSRKGEAASAPFAPS